MPLLTLFQLAVEGGRAEEVGPLSYEVGDSFLAFRHFLDGLSMFSFPYDFWDPRTAKRMLRVLEKGNKIGDHDGKVTVIPVKNANPGNVSEMDKHMSQQNTSLQNEQQHDVAGNLGTPVANTFVGSEDDVGTELNWSVRLSSDGSNDILRPQPSMSVSGPSGSQGTAAGVSRDTNLSSNEPEIVGSLVGNVTNPSSALCVREDFQSRWLAKTDTLIGFCGPKVQHLCVNGQEILVGDSEQGFETIMSSFQDQIIGSHARVFIVNPLHEDMPRMCIFATTTCNSFRSPWVRDQWDQAEEMWNVYCRADVGPLIGHSSDGDPRRRKLMLEDFRGKGIVLRRQSLGWAGWRLTHSWLKNGDAHGLHDSDFMHDLKKGVGPMDSACKVLHCGNGVITLEHLELMYQLHSVLEHGLNKDDLARTDRQNWASAQRLCGRKVLVCLQAVRERKDARVEKTLATEMYLTILGDYLDIFLNVRLSLRQRIVLCGKVSFFFRLWRLWLKKGNPFVGGNKQILTQDNMISLEAFHDFQLSCHFVVYLIILFRDKYPDFPVPLHLTGSDVCEQFFSKVGGMKGHEQNYDFAELVQAASSLNRLAELEMYDGVMSVGKSHKKYKNLWMKMHPLLEGETKANMRDFSEVRTNHLVIEALKEGLQEAQNICIRLEMCPSTSASARSRKWWDEPWSMEVELGWEDGVINPVECEDDVENAIDPILEEAADVELEHSSDVERDDRVSDLAVAQVECSHILSEMFQNVEDGVLGGLEEENELQIVPTVVFEGRSIYKSTLVSQLVGNPKLSKDRLVKVRQSIYFNNLVDKPSDREGAPRMPMWVGSDIGVFFLEPIEKGKTRSATKQKKKKSSKATSSSTIVPVLQATERSTWYVGRVQRVKKIYGTSTWARCREPVDLLNRPTAPPSVEGPVCEVLCNWFSSTSTRGKLKYDTTDPQWVDLESVISTVSLRVQPQNSSIFILHPNDMKCLDDFVKSKF